MIHIRKTPRIIQDEDHWGCPYGPYRILNIHGYVEEEFWKELQEFEGYRPEDDCLHLYNGQSMTLEEVLKIPALKMRKLLSKSHSQIWQFNMKTTPNGQDHIRSLAIFGKTTLKRHTIFDTLEIIRLKMNVWIMNKTLKTS